MKKVFLLTENEINTLIKKINRLQEIAYRLLETEVTAKERDDLLTFEKVLVEVKE